jgi:hypothetical protein
MAPAWRYGGNMKATQFRVPVYLDARLKAWLEAEASRRMCSMAQVFRDFLVAEIERRERAAEG